LAHNIQAVRYEPRPSWLCRCSAEMPLECVAIRNAAPEPGRQRQLAGMHDRTGGHRGLTAAGGALIGECLGLQQPGSAFAAAEADEPLWPTALEKVLCARVFSR